MKKVQRVEALFELLRVVLGLVIAYIITLVLIILTSDVTPSGSNYKFRVRTIYNAKTFWTAYG